MADLQSSLRDRSESDNRAKLRFMLSLVRSSDWYDQRTSRTRKP